MSFLTMADNSVPITANRDGALYNVALSNQSFIIKGIGAEYEPSVTGLQFSVGTGIAVLKGRHVTSEQVTEDNTITLPANTSGFVVIRFDLTRPVGAEAYLFATPTITQEDINNNGLIFDMPIVTFTSTLTNASITDIRAIKDKVNGFEYTEVAYGDDKLIQLWEDPVHSVALYPNSVATAIRWNNEKTLTEKINDVEAMTGVKCINVNRLLGTNQLTYTNTNEDVCIVCNSNSDKTLSVKIDNVSVCNVVDTRSGVAQLLFYLKKGHTLVQAGGTNKIYGVL